MVITRSLAALLAAALLVAGCSDDDDGAPAASSTPGSTAPTTTTGDSTPGTDTTDASIAARIANVTPAPDGSPIDSDIRAGYSETEYFVDGTALSFVPVGELGDDGEWDLDPGEEADYRTRILVRTPIDPDDFSGFTIVEWNNVTAGIDATPDWSFLAPEIVRRGHAYVAVTAQRIGVEGADPAAGGLTIVEDGGLSQRDPERYGDLVHPGDEYSYDIFGQVLGAIRAGDVLGELTPEFVMAVGESQSAFRLTAFVNGVHEIHPFDGYLVHSRGGGAAGFGEFDFSEALDGSVRLRDVGVPVLVLSTETDVKHLGYANARQPDTETFRSWEVAGAAHADTYLLGEAAAEFLDCEGPINDGPQYLVARAALAALVDWVGVGQPAPTFPPLELASAEVGIELERDEFGIAVGGVRTPAVDAPKNVLTGDPQPGSVLCFLSGSTEPLDLVARYGNVENYRSEFTDALDKAIEAGAILPADAGEARDDGEVESFG